MSTGFVLRACLQYLTIFIIGISIGLFFIGKKDDSCLTSRHYLKSEANISGYGGFFDKMNEHLSGLRDWIPRTVRVNFKKGRLLCMVNSDPNLLHIKAATVNNTWGRRCDILLFVSERPHPDLPILKVDVPTGRKFLTLKHRQALDLLYKNYLNLAEWFLKADDDTYVFVDNLRDYLSDKNYNDPSYYGHLYAFARGPKSGYFSGGSGYVFSRKALKTFGQRKDGVYSGEVSADDDLILGFAMERLGVKHVDGRDSQNRVLFHPLALATNLNGGYTNAILEYEKSIPAYGVNNLTDRPISFHYVNPLEMKILEYFTYRVKTPEKCRSN